MIFRVFALAILFLIISDTSHALYASTSPTPLQQVIGYELCIRRWQWTTDDPPGMSYWTAANRQEAHGWHDLRRSDQKIDEIARGWQLVSYKRTGFCIGPDVLLNLGTDINRTMTPLEIATLRAAIELKSDVILEKNTVGDILFELRTNKASVDRTTGLWPLKANSDGNIRMVIPGVGEVGQTNARDNETVQALLIDEYHDYYRTERIKYGFDIPDVLRKKTQATAQRLGVTYFEIIPPLYVMDGWLPHATRGTEDFPSPTDPCDDTLTWTETDGDWDPGTTNCSLESDDSQFNSLLSDAGLSNTDQQCTVEIDTLNDPGTGAAVLGGVHG